MTSPATDAATRKHFRDHAFFGLREAQVAFFSQGALPALTEQGRIIRESACRLSMAPDGNGGVYMALRAAGVLADMAAHGVEAVDCYCVDNALVRLGDPLFTGFCHSRGVQCGECLGRGGWWWWRVAETAGAGWRVAWQHLACRGPATPRAPHAPALAPALHPRTLRQAAVSPLPPTSGTSRPPACPQARAWWPRRIPRRRWGCLRGATARWRWWSTLVRPLPLPLRGWEGVVLWGQAIRARTRGGRPRWLGCRTGRPAPAGAAARGAPFLRPARCAPAPSRA